MLLRTNPVSCSLTCRHLDDGLSDSGMWSRCERDNGRGNCQKDGLIVYPRCRPGFHQVGCCICSPDCPSDTTDVGISCQKNLHGVGGPKPLVCPSDRKMDGVLLSCVPNDCVTDALPALSGTPTNKQVSSATLLLCKCWQICEGNLLVLQFYL